MNVWSQETEHKLPFWESTCPRTEHSLSSRWYNQTVKIMKREHSEPLFTGCTCQKQLIDMTERLWNESN